MARNFQTQVTTTKVTKPMKMSFATEVKAREDIASMVEASRTHCAEAWGSVTRAVIINKETGETITVI